MPRQKAIRAEDDGQSSAIKHFSHSELSTSTGVVWLSPQVLVGRAQDASAPTDGHRHHANRGAAARVTTRRGKPMNPTIRWAGIEIETRPRGTVGQKCDGMVNR